MIWWRDVMIIGFIVGLSIPVGRYIAAVMAGKKGVVKRGFKTSGKTHLSCPWLPIHTR